MLYRNAAALLLLLLAVGPSAAVAAPAQQPEPRPWTAMGPPGGEVEELHRLADGRVLAESWPGLVFVTDAPVTGAEPSAEPAWTLAAATPRDGGRQADGVTPDPSDPRVLYAAGPRGIQRSSDGGATWERLTGEDASRFTLVALPGGGATVLLRLADGAVERSADRGATWTPVDTGLAVRRLVAVGERGALAAGAGPAGAPAVARSDDGGATFQPPVVLPGFAGPERVVSLAAAPSAPRRLYVLTSTGRILASTDGGASWRPASAVLPPPFGRTARLRVDPDAPDLLYARVPPGLHVSRDGGVTWRRADLPPEVRSALPLPGAGDRVLAATTGGLDPSLPVGGLYRSDDGGDRWRPASRGLQAHASAAVTLRPGEPSEVLVNAGGRLLHRAGTAWTPVEVPPVLAGAPGPPAGPITVGRPGISPRRPERWLVPVSFEAATTGLPLRSPGLQVSDDDGATWSPQPISDLPVQVVPAPSRPGVAYLTAVAAGPPEPTFCHLFRWSGGEGGVECLAVSPDPGLASLVVTDLAVDAADPELVYGVEDSTLWVSRDGGVTRTGAGLPFPVASVAAHPLVPGLAAVGGARGEVRVSEDGGATWVSRAEAPPGEGRLDGPVGPLRFDPLEEDRLYVVADGFLHASEDGGRTWARVPGGGLPDGARVSGLEVDATDPSVLHATLLGGGAWRLHRRFPVAPCTPDAHTLCLGEGDRFRVRVAWQDFEHGAGRGRVALRTAASEDSQTGAFWFFDPANVELLVKLIDGADVNGRHWVFYGALTNVPFTLVVTDTATGESVGYHNPARRFASRGDTTAFPEGAPGTPAPPPGDTAPPLRDTVEPAPCVASVTVLCLGEGDRFRVEVAWEDFQGGSGAGTAVPRPPSSGDPSSGDADTGFFWFFRETNLELAVKVLDGRSVNGRFWVFYGALTNVPFRLTVTDTVTGDRNTYVNPSRNFASRGDTAAF